MLSLWGPFSTEGKARAHMCDMGQDGWERHRRVGKPAGHVTKVKGARQKAINRCIRLRAP